MNWIFVKYECTLCLIRKKACYSFIKYFSLIRLLAESILQSERSESRHFFSLHGKITTLQRLVLCVTTLERCHWNVGFNLNQYRMRNLNCTMKQFEIWWNWSRKSRVGRQVQRHTTAERSCHGPLSRVSFDLVLWHCQEGQALGAQAKGFAGRHFVDHQTTPITVLNAVQALQMWWLSVSEKGLVPPERFFIHQLIRCSPFLSWAKNNTVRLLPISSFKNI